VWKNVAAVRFLVHPVCARLVHTNTRRSKQNGLLSRKKMNSDYPYRRPPLALIITGQEWVSLAVETLFSPRGYAVLRAFTGRQALSRVRDARPDFLCIERDLQDIRGVDLCHVMREQALISKVTPVMMIAPSHWQREDRLAALRAGAWDCAALPTDGEELFLRIDAWVQAKLAADLTGEQGLLDPSTGFYNAQGLLRRIAELGAGAGRSNRALACVVLSPETDVVTATGTGMLRAVEPATQTSSAIATLATRLKAAGRASDTIGRLSESEFVVVAPDTDIDGVMRLANRLKAVIETPRTDELNELRVRVGCYAVPNFRDASIAPTEMLIRAAEALRTADSDRRPIQFFSRYDISN
jgi:PleD family two-component response regulator